VTVSDLGDWTTNGTSTINLSSSEVYTIYEHDTATETMLIDADISVA